MDRVLHPSERPRKPLSPPDPMAADTRTRHYLQQAGLPAELAEGRHTAAFLTGPQQRRVRKKINHALRKKRRET